MGRKVEKQMQHNLTVRQWGTCETQRQRGNPFIQRVFWVGKHGFIGENGLMIRCRECKVIRPAKSGYYNPKPTAKTKYEAWCSDCRRRYQREYYLQRRGK